MSINFDFLKTVELSTPDVKEVQSRVSSIKNPEGLAIRVFGNGKVYPSAELVAKYNLEYQPKGSDNATNGLDVFNSKDWNMFPSNAPQHVVFIAIVPKSSTKIDLFGQVGYNDDNTPKSTVMEQGGGSFGKEFKEMVESVYGIEIGVREYRDFKVSDDIIMKSETGIYFMPKTVTRGAHKGEISVVRRENVSVIPLVPMDSEFGEPDSEVEEVSQGSGALTNPEVSESQRELFPPENDETSGDFWEVPSEDELPVGSGECPEAEID